MCCHTVNRIDLACFWCAFVYRLSMSARVLRDRTTRKPQSALGRIRLLRCCDSRAFFWQFLAGWLYSLEMISQANPFIRSRSSIHWQTVSFFGRFVVVAAVVVVVVVVVVVFCQYYSRMHVNERNPHQTVGAHQQRAPSDNGISPQPREALDYCYLQIHLNQFLYQPGQQRRPTTITTTTIL